MKVWVFLRSSIDSLPPVVSMIESLRKLGNDVCLVLGDRPSTLINEKYKVYCVESKGSRLVSYLRFRQYASKVAKNISKDDFIWIASLDTLISMKGLSVFYKHSYGVQIHELYDQHRLRLRLVKSELLKSSLNVVPDETRAFILYNWLNLKKVPSVIPNKPVMTSGLNIDSSIVDGIQNINVLSFSSRKRIIYQGHIGKDRGLTALAIAMKSLVESWDLILIGPDHGYVDALVSESENIYYLGNFQAPAHLLVTEKCHIGVLKYDPISLNNIFCAPNKVWEYAFYGLPFISNIIPPLNNIARTYFSGLTCDMDCPMEIIKSIKEVELDLNSYQQAARCFYASVDIVELWGSLISSVKKV